MNTEDTRTIIDEQIVIMEDAIKNLNTKKEKLIHIKENYSNNAKWSYIARYEVVMKVLLDEGS